jgi:hypothetical protein
MLQCSRGVPYRATNNQEKENSNELSPRHVVIETSDLPEISYKPNIKSTKLVNHQSVCRGLLGRSGPKKTQLHHELRKRDGKMHSVSQAQEVISFLKSEVSAGRKR